MTCIVALKKDGKVYMGADSAGVGGLSIRTRKDPKVHKVGEFIFGFTSSFRMGQLLGYAFNPPTLKEGQSIDSYMVTDFIDAIRNCFKDGGVVKTESGVEECGVFLVGFRGRIFRIDSDFQVGESLLDYESVGCGEDIAMGSLYTSGIKGDYSPEDRINLALQAAQEFSAGVRAPFIVESI